jgi:hypothetical protein
MGRNMIQHLPKKKFDKVLPQLRPYFLISLWFPIVTATVHNLGSFTLLRPWLRLQETIGGEKARLV